MSMRIEDNRFQLKENSSGLGDRSCEIPYRRYSPRPASAADLVKFQNRQ